MQIAKYYGGGGWEQEQKQKSIWICMLTEGRWGENKKKGNLRKKGERKKANAMFDKIIIIGACLIKLEAVSIIYYVHLSKKACSGYLIKCLIVWLNFIYISLKYLLILYLMSYFYFYIENIVYDNKSFPYIFLVVHFSCKLCFLSI